MRQIDNIEAFFQTKNGDSFHREIIHKLSKHIKFYLLIALN